MESENFSELTIWALKIVIAAAITGIVATLILSCLALGALALSFGMRRPRVPIKQKDPEKGSYGYGNVTADEKKYFDEVPDAAFGSDIKVKTVDNKAGAAAAPDKTHLAYCMSANDTKLGANLTHHIYYNGQKVALVMKKTALDDLPKSWKRAFAKENALQQFPAKENASEDKKLSVETKAECAEVAALEKAISAICSAGYTIVKTKQQPINLEESVNQMMTKAWTFNKEISTNGPVMRMTLAESIKQTTARVQAFNKELSSNNTGTSIIKGLAPISQTLPLTGTIKASSAMKINDKKAVAPVAKML